MFNDSNITKMSNEAEMIEFIKLNFNKIHRISVKFIKIF